MIVKKTLKRSLAQACRDVLGKIDAETAWFMPNEQLTQSFRTTLQRASKQTGIKITTKREPEGLYIWRKE
jgi:hypothetical protein